MCKEFTIINRYFNRTKKLRLDVKVGIGDDCSILNIPSEKMLAVSTDTLVCGRHFLSNISPSDLAYKALAVNISDLAAMGADPAWLMLALTLPEVNEHWLEKFSNTLFDQLNQYNIQLIGGDITSGPLSLTLSIYGFVPIGYVLKRSGANPGDWIYVTGTLGDSASGLAILQNKLAIKNSKNSEYLVKRHLRPTPRISHGQALLKIASSAIDLSDGLMSDLKHILKASKVGAIVDIDACPISSELSKHVKMDQLIALVLFGGEDYELLFTVGELHHNKLDSILSHLNTPFTCIGQILPKDEGLKFIKDGKLIKLDWKGYEHFA